MFKGASERAFPWCQNRIQEGYACAAIVSIDREAPSFHVSRIERVPVLANAYICFDPEEIVYSRNVQFFVMNFNTRECGALLEMLLADYATD